MHNSVLLCLHHGKPSLLMTCMLSSSGIFKGGGWILADEFSFHQLQFAVSVYVRSEELWNTHFVFHSPCFYPFKPVDII